MDGEKLFIRIIIAFLLVLYGLETVNAKNIDFRLELARKLAKQGKIEAAAREYKNYLVEQPKSADVFSELGQLRIIQGKFKLAVLNFQSALRNDPDYIEAQEGLASAYEWGGEREKAIVEWRKLVTISSSSAQKSNAEKRIADLLYDIRANNQISVSDFDGSNFTQTNYNDTLPGESNPNQKDFNSQNAQQLATAPKETFKKSDAPFADSPSIPESARKISPSSNGSMGSEELSEPDIYKIPNFISAVDHFYKKNYRKAMEEIHKCLRAVPDHPGAYYYAGIIRYENGEYDKAKYNLTKGLSYPEEGINGHFYLGRLYQKLNQMEKSAEEYKKFISLTKSSEGKLQAGEYLSQLTDTTGKASQPSAKKEEAKPEQKKKKLPVKKSEVKPDKKTMKIDNETLSDIKVLIFPGIRFFIPEPDHIRSAGLKDAGAQLAEKKPDNAINSLKKVIREYGGTAQSRYAGADIASIYFALGLYEKTINEADEFINSGDQTGITDQILFLKAKSLVRLKEFGKAEEVLKKIKPNEKYGPDSRDLNFEYSDLYVGKKNYKDAILYLKKNILASISKAHKAELYNKISEYYLLSGQSSKSIEHLNQVNKICLDTVLPDICPDNFMKIGDSFFKEQKWQSAMKMYEQFEKLYPQHKEMPWVYYQKANIQKSKGQYKQALDSYRAVIEKYPDSYWAIQAKWKQEDAVWKNEFKEMLN